MQKNFFLILKSKFNKLVLQINLFVWIIKKLVTNFYFIDHVEIETGKKVYIRVRSHLVK